MTSKQFRQAPFVWWSNIWEFIPTYLREVTAQKEPPNRLLNTTTHLHQILQNILRRSFLWFDVHRSNSDKQVPEQQSKQSLHLNSTMITLKHKPNQKHNQNIRLTKWGSYSLGKMFPECWTSSYKSALVRPRFVSSLKKVSSCRNSSKVLIS